MKTLDTIVTTIEILEHRGGAVLAMLEVDERAECDGSRAFEIRRGRIGLANGIGHWLRGASLEGPLDEALSVRIGKPL